MASLGDLRHFVYPFYYGLWPLLSTAFVKNPTLSDFQIDLFSIIFLVYPFILVLIARLLYKLHQRKPKLAVKLLLLSAVIFTLF